METDVKLRVGAGLCANLVRELHPKAAERALAVTEACSDAAVSATRIGVARPTATAAAASEPAPTDSFRT